jgi:hypothetical protein
LALDAQGSRVNLDVWQSAAFGQEQEPRMDFVFCGDSGFGKTQTPFFLTLDPGSPGFHLKCKQQCSTDLGLCSRVDGSPAAHFGQCFSTLGATATVLPAGSRLPWRARAPLIFHSYNISLFWVQPRGANAKPSGPYSRPGRTGAEVRIGGSGGPAELEVGG